jgi:hypothetical protein
MPTQPRRPASLLVAGALLALACGNATAQPLSYGGYGQPVYGAPSYAFAGNAVSGAYIGAPFTRVPSPSRLVPPAWGYGTYGVPTVAGIRETPSARPALYVIERQGRAQTRLLPRRSAKIVSRGSDGRWTDVAPRSEIGAAERSAVEDSGAQVVSVRVPSR